MGMEVVDRRGFGFQLGLLVAIKIAELAAEQIQDIQRQRNVPVDTVASLKTGQG